LSVHILTSNKNTFLQRRNGMKIHIK